MNYETSAGVWTLSQLLSSTFIQPGYYPVLEEVQMNFNIHLMFTRKMNSASAGAKETRYSRAMSKV